MKTEPLHPGQHVRFKLADVHLPAIDEILTRMTDETELQGTITLLSDQGDKKTAFAVIEVLGVLMPIIVPADSLKCIADPARMTAAKSW